MSVILTLTPNSALDKVLFVDHFAFGETVRASATADGMGGKGAVVSWVLGQLGTPNLATGFAAGDTGRRMVGMLEDKDVRADFLWVGGETRINYVLARNADGVQGTITVAGLQIAAQDPPRLAAHVLAHLDKATVLLCGGSLVRGMPTDWYVPLLRAAKARGVLTLLDTSDQFLTPNLVGQPDIIKPNAAEASTLMGRPVRTVAEAREAVVALRTRGIAVPLVTLGELGAVAGTPEGLFYLPPLAVRVVSTAGAGDGFNAGLLQARTRGESWAESLRWAVAVATAVLLTPGTGEVRPQDVRALHPLVRLERLEEG
jgi:1-phosphofructokinase family hexose kinase